MRFILSMLLITMLSRAVHADNSQPAILRDVGIDQKLNQQIPFDLRFRDESGREVRIGDYFTDKPVVLSLVYYECPMLCTLVLNDLLRGLKLVPLNVGEDFEVLTISFDPRETPDLAAAKKRKYIEQYNREGASEGWHFLTGNEASIRQLTEAVGFRYVYDIKTEQYVHASGIMILTPQGRISRYFFGIAYEPKDLRLSLVEASGNRVGSLTDQVLLYCFHYDPATGKYGFAVMNALRAGGGLTVLALGTFLFAMFRRDRKRGEKLTTDEHG